MIIKQTFYIKGTKAAGLTFNEDTLDHNWELYDPWKLLIYVTGNRIPVEVVKGENFGIETVSDLKMKIFGQDTWVMNT